MNIIEAKPKQPKLLSPGNLYITKNFLQEMKQGKGKNISKPELAEGFLNPWIFKY